MTAYLHHPTGLETGTVYRADTASGSSTPTTVYTDRAAAQPIANQYGLTGSTLRAGGTSADPGVGFYSSVQTIYLKPVTYQGVLVGSGTVTSTGAGTDPTPSPTQSSLFEQVWATPAASTTLTGTLTAWTVTSVDCTAGPGARALPAASSVAAGVAVCAKKSDTSSNALVLSRAGSDLIFGMGSGGTSKTLNLPGETAELVSNGVDRWTVRASDTPVSQLDARYNSTYARRLPDSANRTVAALPKAPLGFPALSATVPLFGTTNTATPSSGVEYAVNAANTGCAYWYGPAAVTTGTVGGVANCVQSAGDIAPSPIWWEFITDAPQFALHGAFGSSPWSMIVDGELMMATPRAAAANSYLTVSWDGIRKLRHYKVYAGNGFTVAGVRVGVADTVFQPPGVGRRPLVGWMADSYGQAGNTPATGTALGGIPFTAGLLLDWRLRLDADGGTGWQTTSGSSQAFSTRTTLDSVPLDAMVFAGGINDSATGLQAAATARLQAFRAAQPSTPVLVIGPWSPSATSETSQAAKWTALAAAAAAVSNCTFVDNRGWITGTGKVGSTVGDGNADVLISSDGTHPQAAVGDYYLASRFVRAVLAAWGF